MVENVDKWKSIQLQVFNSKGIQSEQRTIINELAFDYYSDKDYKVGYNITRKLDSIKGIYTLYVKKYDDDQITIDYIYSNKSDNITFKEPTEEYTILLPETADPSIIPDIKTIEEEIKRIKETEQYVEPDSKTIEARFESDLKNWPDFRNAIQEMGLESRGKV